MIRVQARGPSEAEILIHEAIGENWFGDGLTSKKFAEDLAKLGDVHKITVRINSPGGAVYDGVAIYNALRLHGARVHVLVEGLAASIASVIAMAGDEIEMGVGAMMMIHQPWTFAIGNADDMREIAEVLDKHTEGLVDIYSKRTGRERAEIAALLAGETWFTPTEAVAQKFADSVSEDEEKKSEETAKASIATHRKEYEDFVQEFRQHTAKLTPLQIAAAIKSAAADATQESEMRVKAQPASAQNTTDPPASTTTPTPAPAPAAPTAPTAAQIEAARLAGAQAEAQRRTDIRARFGRFSTEHSALLAECENDPNCTPQVAADKLLAKLGANTAPARDPAAIIVPGPDEREKLRDAATIVILNRVGSGTYDPDPDSKRDKFPKVDNGNPFRGFSLFDIAEHCVQSAGISTRGMNRSQIVAAAFGHTTSDFPNLLENTMHKLLIVAYQGANTTWARVARVGDLTDFRAHPRYRFGTFSDIQAVNEAGRYPQGTISDAEKETITARRKGRILVITREMIVNDDLQALSDAARGLGRAANRTIDKDLYALLALNSGNGPTMGDTVALFNGTTTGHKNIAVTAAAPTVVSVDAGRVQMAKQLDTSGNDYIDVRPAIVWSPLALGSTFRTLNDAQFDPADNKFQKPNYVRGLVRDVVDTPRLDALSAQVWYLLADPQEEPVFEVGFIGGAREPRVEQDQEFTSDSLQWKVVHEYGVAAIGWRGILKNAGA